MTAMSCFDIFLPIWLEKQLDYGRNNEKCPRKTVAGSEEPQSRPHELFSASKDQTLVTTM